MEILSESQYGEYEEFVGGHKNGVFLQSSNWREVKNNWGFEAIVSRCENGRIKGSCGVLVQKIPALNTSFLYAPRGPVCDYHDRETLADLKSGADFLAKKYNAHTFKWDPDTLISDTETIEIMNGMGFHQIAGNTGFETIQARFNYRLYLGGRTEDELFMNLTQKTRYNVRVAMKKGVVVKAVGADMLPEFVQLMKITGERDGFNVRPAEYFLRMLSALGEHVRLYMGFYEDKPICGAISTNYAGKVCYVYGASDNEHRNVMSTYILQWEMIRWAVETGAAVYDFQGVSGDLSEDNPLYGLYRFKNGFNGTLDELCGEFDYVYHPTTAALVEKAMAAREGAIKIKNKLTSRG